MSESFTFDGRVAVESDRVALEKSVERDSETANITLAIEVPGELPVAMRIADALPTTVTSDVVAVPEASADHWRISDEQVVYAAVVTPEGRRVRYEVTAVGDAPDGAFLTEPTIGAAEAVDSDVDPDSVPLWRDSGAESSDAAGGESVDDDGSAAEGNELNQADAEQESISDLFADVEHGDGADADSPVPPEDPPAPEAAGTEADDESATETPPEPPEDPAEEVEGEPPVLDESRLSTGVDELDRQLNGGIPPGRIAALIAPPDSQSELLIERLASQRDTVFLTTTRPEWEVEGELDDALPGDVEVSVVSPDIEELVTDPMSYLDAVGRESNLIIDCVNELENVDRDQYLDFFNVVKRQLRSTGSVGLFHVVDSNEIPTLRSVTLNRADLTWELEVSVDSMTVNNLLIVTKFRGGEALTEPIKLVLTDDVQVDTSRDIA